jgi:hypothetical protein
MPEHRYTPEQALDLLMKKLLARDEALAAQVQAALDAGKDVSETEPAIDRRKKARVYRKTVPFTHEEALQIALDALQAYFVEQPLFVASAADNLAKSAIGVPARRTSNFQWSSEEAEPVSLEAEGVEKAVEIEMQTETQLSRTGEETIPFKRVPERLVEYQRFQVTHLRELTDFSGLRNHDLERIAKAIHESYREVVGTAQAGWTELSEAIKDSCREQAAAISAMLLTVGLRLVPASDEPALFEFVPGMLERLAQLEHERWLSARTMAGWRYAPIWDKALRTHPGLLPWEKLPEPQKEKDRTSIRMIPRALATAGYKIVKP